MTGPTYDCLLTLALPADLEEEVLDHLAGHPEWVSGFSIVHAEGVGGGTHLRSTMEQVRGRARRRLIQLLMRGEHVTPLVESLRATFRTPEIAWWTAPLTGFGRLG
jgi:hypothetical protein